MPPVGLPSNGGNQTSADAPAEESRPSRERLPLDGLRVIEFTHMVMGPTCGMILGDLGAEVIKVEPLVGDNTRRLLGSGAGFYGLFNRNKKSLALNVADPRGLEIVLKLLADADVFSENFKPGAMARLGLGADLLAQLNPRLICVSHKGFLPGPYDHRTALDEVVQMMGGLAYMTGPEGRPLRAGTSVNDIMGGMFGAIGTLGALIQRGITGKGMEVQSALFENNVFLMGQHMLQFAMTGKHPAPMPARDNPWAVYDVFTVKDGEQVFLSAVSDRQWAVLCREFGWSDLLADARLVSNNHRVRARDWLLPLLRERFAPFSASDLASRFEASGLPFAPITRPEDLFDDPHLLATGGLALTCIPPDGSAAGEAVQTRAALLPLALDGHRLPLRSDPPRLGQHTRELLLSVGYSPAEIDQLCRDAVIGDPAA